MVNILNWTGGMVNDDNLGSENQVIYMQDTNIQRTGHHVEIAPKSTTKLSNINDWGTADYVTSNYYKHSIYGQETWVLEDGVIATTEGRLLSLNDGSELFQSPKSAWGTYDPVLALHGLGESLYIVTKSSILQRLEGGFATYGKIGDFDSDEWFPKVIVKGITMSSDGTKMLITGQVETTLSDIVVSFTLATANDPRTLSDPKLYYTSEADWPTGIDINADGTKMYLLDSSNVYQYSLSTAYDASTATYDSVSFSYTSGDGLRFKPDGTKMFIVNGGAIYDYDLSIAWDLSTAVANSSFNFSATQEDGTGVFFKTDGTKMFITGWTLYELNSYNMSAWNISTAVHNDVGDLSGGTTTPEDVFINSDGTKVFIASSGDGLVHRGTVGVGWNTGSINLTSVFTTDYNFVTLSATNAFEHLQTLDSTSTSLYLNKTNELIKIVDGEPATSSLPWGVDTLQDRIVGVTKHQDNIWIYTEDGQQYIWNVTSLEIIAEKQWSERILSVFNAGWYDIVVTGNSSLSRGIYTNGGVWPNSEQLIATMTWSDVVEKFIGNQGYRFGFSDYFPNDKTLSYKFNLNQNHKFAKHDNMIYFAGSQWGNDVVYSYGTRTPWLPPSFSILSTQDADGTDYENILALWVVNDTLYISHTKDSAGHVSSVNIFRGEYTGSYQPSAKIVTKTDNLGDYSVMKELKQVRLWAKIPDGTSIDIDYIVDGGAVQSYYSIDSYNAHDLEFNKTIENFREITWCITLNTNDAWTATPELYSFIADIWPVQYEIASS